MALKNQVVRRLVEKLAVHITATYKYLTNPQLESLLLLHTGGAHPWRRYDLLDILYKKHGWKQVFGGGKTSIRTLYYSPLVCDVEAYAMLQALREDPTERQRAKDVKARKSKVSRTGVALEIEPIKPVPGAEPEEEPIDVPVYNDLSDIDTAVRRMVTRTGGVFGFIWTP